MNPFAKHKAFDAVVAQLATLDLNVPELLANRDTEAPLAEAITALVEAATTQHPEPAALTAEHPEVAPLIEAAIDAALTEASDQALNAAQAAATADLLATLKSASITLGDPADAADPAKIKAALDTRISAAAAELLAQRGLPTDDLLDDTATPDATKPGSKGALTMGLEDFRALSHPDRARFRAKGGKLVDD